MLFIIAFVPLAYLFFLILQCEQAIEEMRNCIKSQKEKEIFSKQESLEILESSFCAFKELNSEYANRISCLKMPFEEEN